MSDSRNPVLAGKPDSVGLRARNRRTGLVLLCIALVFFAGVILQYALH